ncbi:MAG: hypothetical protein IPM55_04840 [Acidobacteria bacterium]|nr:hypothetical protein [Acidobacteriota bacterium]
MRVNRAAARHNTEEFNRVKSHCVEMAPAPTMQQMAEKYTASQQGGTTQYPSDSRIEQSVQQTSSTYRSYTGGNLFAVNVPDNWEQFEAQNVVTFAPRGAYGTYQGQPVFTHGYDRRGLVNPQDAEPGRGIGSLCRVFVAE